MSSNDNEMNSNGKSSKVDETMLYAIALLKSLKYNGGIKFLRYLTIDVCNNIRCKVIPIDHLLQKASECIDDEEDSDSSNNFSLNYQVSIATICYGGLPYYADSMITGTNITASNVVIIKPDISTLQVNLPYVKHTACVLGTIHDQYSNTNVPSPLCTRTILQNVINDAKRNHNIEFVSLHIFFKCCSCFAIELDFVVSYIFFHFHTFIHSLVSFFLSLYLRFLLVNHCCSL